jgi:quercetin dioxygenase-like cupin family protein
MVLDGEIELLVGEEVHKLGPGDSFTFISEIEHGYRNIGIGVAQIFWVNTPPTF